MASKHEQYVLFQFNKTEVCVVCHYIVGRTKEYSTLIIIKLGKRNLNV